MLKLENCTYDLVVNLSFAVLLRRPSVKSCHWSNAVGDPPSLSCPHEVCNGRRIAHLIWQLGVGIILNQCRRVSLQVHACLHGSWLGESLCPYACPHGSRLGYALGLGFGEVRFSLLGHGLVRVILFGHEFVRLSLFGHGLVKFSLLGMDGWGSLSQGMDWGGTISLKAWIGAGPSLFEAGLFFFGIGQSHHVSDVLSLDTGYLSMCTLSAGRV